MEWVETTGKTLDAAKDKALDQLGVARDEAEFEVLEEPRSGLFGLLRGEARVRARVAPASVRPKNNRRRNRKGGSRDGEGGSSKQRKSNGGKRSSRSDSDGGDSGASADEGDTGRRDDRSSNGRQNKRQRASSSDKKSNNARPEHQDQGSGAAKEATMNSTEEMSGEAVPPEEVAGAARSFLEGLVDAFDADATVTTQIDGEEIDVAVDGEELGLLIGPSGRTLNAIQDLTRVSAQRRLGDRDTRLRIDVAGYREKRRAALEQFTRKVAADVIESGEARALEPMASADRKVVHDTVNSMDEVESRSDGTDPNRRVIIVPAED